MLKAHRSSSNGMTVITCLENSDALVNIVIPALTLENIVVSANDVFV